jgi:hypothetical protein
VRVIFTTTSETGREDSNNRKHRSKVFIPNRGEIYRSWSERKADSRIHRPVLCSLDSFWLRPTLSKEKLQQEFLRLRAKACWPAQQVFRCGASGTLSADTCLYSVRMFLAMIFDLLFWNDSPPKRWGRLFMGAASGGLQGSSVFWSLANSIPFVLMNAVHKDEIQSPCSALLAITVWSSTPWFSAGRREWLPGRGAKLKTLVIAGSLRVSVPRSASLACRLPLDVRSVTSIHISGLCRTVLMLQLSPPHQVQMHQTQQSLLVVQFWWGSLTCDSIKHVGR